MVSAAALVRRWRATAAVALGLAIAVKFLPVVLLPLYWKRVRIRDAALAAAVVGLLYVPFLNHGRIPIGSLGTYVQTFRFNGPVFAALDRWCLRSCWLGLAVLADWSTATWLRSDRPSGLRTLFAWPMAASLLCAPAVFPWYLLWLVPFLTSPSTLLIILWTVSIIPTYVSGTGEHLGVRGGRFRLGHAAGIRMRGNGRCHDCIAPVHAAEAASIPERTRLIS